MAQEGKRGRSARRTAHRLGALGWGLPALALVVVAAVVAGALAFARGPSRLAIERASEPAAEREASDEEGEREDPGAPVTIVVHVDGAVVAPGVYALAEGARVGEAVGLAGGLAEGADTSALNLAAPLSDGEKVHVPLVGEAAPTASASGAGADGVLVNINTATVAELDELPGVGEATATAIVEDREANGPFSTPEDLMRVSGIGEKKFERLEAMVCV